MILNRRVVRTVAVLFIALAGVCLIWFWRAAQRAANFSVLFRGYSLLGSAPTASGIDDLNLDNLSLSAEPAGSLNPGHVYLFKKTAQFNETRFVRYWLPLRFRLAGCRQTHESVARSFAGGPFFEVAFACDGHNGEIKNRHIGAPEPQGVEEQLVVLYK